MALQPGTPAPDFTLNSHNGEPVTLSSFRGKPVLLAFHPLAFTGGCTNQVNGFCSNVPRFNKAGVQVLEVSVDSAASLKAWAGTFNGVEFPLLADFHPKGEVAKKYEVYNEERGTARRSAFVIDRQGVIRWSKEYPQGQVPTVDELLAEAAKL